MQKLQQRLGLLAEVVLVMPATLFFGIISGAITLAPLWALLVKPEQVVNSDSMVWLLLGWLLLGVVHAAGLVALWSAILTRSTYVYRLPLAGGILSAIPFADGGLGEMFHESRAFNGAALMASLWLCILIALRHWYVAYARDRKNVEH